MTKDHIVPICHGGSDSIDNIQPICIWCNKSKGGERFNWADFRLKKGWVRTNLKLAKTHPLKTNILVFG